MLLAGDPVRLLYVSGAGGIGKSTLLRAMGRRAADAGYAVVTLDGRDLQPFPSVLNEALAPAMVNDRTLVVIDSYEMISSLDGWLREVVIPDLPRLDHRRVRLTATSVARLVRGRLGRRVRIDGTRGTLDRRSPGTRAGERRTAAGGRLAGEAGPRVTAGGDGRSARRPAGGSVADLADRLLGHEVDSDRYRTLSVAAIARVTTPELLEAVQPGTDGHEAYKWLADRSFSEPLADGIALHTLVADAVRAVLRERDPDGRR